MAGMAKKILNGVGDVVKEFTNPNTIANGGGLSSVLIPRRLNAKGGAALVGGVAAVTLVGEGVKGNSRAKIGRISYGDGMARMTDSFTTGAVPAMKRASGGDYAAFADMAQNVVQSPNLAGRLDDFGANADMISALYNMGGN